MIVFECPVPVITPFGVLRESEFSEADGWSFEVAGEFVTIERAANEAENIRAVPPCEIRGYAFSFTKESRDAAQVRQKSEDDQQKHRNRGPGRKAAKAGDSDRNEQGGQEQEKAKVADGRDRELGRLLG